jgi:hypothetical protein
MLTAGILRVQVGRDGSRQRDHPVLTFSLVVLGMNCKIGDWRCWPPSLVDARGHVVWLLSQCGCGVGAAVMGDVAERKTCADSE